MEDNQTKPPKELLKSAAVAGPTPLVTRGEQEIRARVNGVQKVLRVQQVTTWLLDGLTTAQVLSKCDEKWGISSRQAERYIADAKEQVEAMSATEVRGATTLALYRLTQLYEAAVASEDFKTALDIVKVTNRMLGLNAPEKIEAKTVADWDSLSVAEQLEQVSGILSRAGIDDRVTN